MSNREKLDKLAPRHKKAALMMTQGHSPQETADELGVSVRTVYKWRCDPLVKQEMDSIYDQMKSLALEQFEMLSVDAVDYLRKALNQEEVNSFGIEAARMVVKNYMFVATNNQQPDPDEDTSQMSPEDAIKLLKGIPRELYEVAQKDQEPDTQEVLELVEA